MKDHVSCTFKVIKTLLLCRMQTSSLLSFTCAIMVINLQLAVGSNISRSISFTGGPIDDLSSASTTARYLVIRTDLMVKLEISSHFELV